MGASKKQALRVTLGGCLKLEFHGAKVTSDTGLLAYRELDTALKIGCLTVFLAILAVCCPSTSLGQTMFTNPVPIQHLERQKPFDFFPISYWTGPPTEDAKYAELAECNFTLALEGDEDLAWKYGMRTLVKNDAAVDENAAKRGFFGVFLDDEPVSADFPKLALQSQQILARHPNAVPFINLNPTYAPLYWLGTTNYEEYVERFIAVVKPKVLCFDHYPLLKPEGLRPDYYENLEIIRRASLKHGIPFWMVVLSTPLGPDVLPAPNAPHLAGPYGDPTEGELRWETYIPLAYGAQGIMYFTYCVPAPQPNVHFGDAIIRRDGSRDPKYEIVKRINAELKALGPTLLPLTSKNVYHVGPGISIPQGASGPPSKALVPKISAGHLVVGEFTCDGGTRYILLANASYSEPFIGDIIFSRAVLSIGEVPKTAGQTIQWQDLPKNGRLAKQQLAAGDGRLYLVK